MSSSTCPADSARAGESSKTRKWSEAFGAAADPSSAKRLKTSNTADTLVNLPDDTQYAAADTTTTHKNSLRPFPGPPDLIVYYDPEVASLETAPRSERLISLCKEEPFFDPYVAATRHILKDLGSLGSDLFWLRSRNRILKYGPGTMKHGPQGDPNGPSANVHPAIFTLYHWKPDTELCLDPTFAECNVSRKFYKLYLILKTFEIQQQDTFRGVIYVTYRFTARVLLDMLGMLKTEFKFLRPQVLLSRGRNDEPENMDGFTQALTLEAFRTGEINLLIVTGMAQTCFELGPTTYIIRWDPVDNYISHLQLKAQANASHAHLLSMYEKGNRAHRRVAMQLNNIPHEWSQWMTSDDTTTSPHHGLHHFGGSHIPPFKMVFNEDFDRYALPLGEPDRVEVEEEDGEEACIVEAMTGAKLYSSDSVRVIYRHAARAAAIAKAQATSPSSNSSSAMGASDSGGGGGNGAIAEKPLFEYTAHQDNSRVSCHIHLPAHPSCPSLFQNFAGPICSTRADARRLACFRACQTLHRMQLLLNPGDFPHPAPIRRPQVLLKTTEDDGMIAGGGVDDGSIAASASAALKVMPVRVAKVGRSYPQAKVGFWERARSNPRLVAGPGPPAICTRLYPMIVTVFSDPGSAHASSSSTRPLKVPYGRPIVLMARQPLPYLAPFETSGLGTDKTIHVRQCAELEVTEVQLRLLRRFTVFLLRAVARTNVGLDTEQGAGEPGCFVAPLSSGGDHPNLFEEDTTGHGGDACWPLLDIKDLVSWDEVRQVIEPIPTYEPIKVGGGHSPSSSSSLENELRDTLILEKAEEFSPIFVLSNVRHDMSPLSKMQGDGVEADYPNLLEYIKVTRHEHSNGLRDVDQPLLEVVPSQNYKEYCSKTTPTTAADQKAKYLIPETCFKHPIDAGLYRTALAIPYVLGTMEDVMLAKTVNAALFDNRINDWLLTTALTTVTAWRGRDLERLELLGDTILKFLICTVLFVYLPPQTAAGSGAGSSHANTMSRVRNKLVSNDTLKRITEDSGITGFIMSKRIGGGAAGWVPPGFRSARSAAERKKGNTFWDIEGGVDVDEVDGRPAVESVTEVTLGEEDAQLTDEVEEQDSSAQIAKHAPAEADIKGVPDGCIVLGGKTVADVCEATLGAAFKSGGHEFALKCLKTMSLPMKEYDRWSDLARHVRVPLPDPKICLPAKAVQELQKIIGFELAQPHLLAWAMTHGSFINQSDTPHEWLEFLGDGLLDYFVVPEIYDAHPNSRPGILTVLKSTMVCTEVLAAICVESGIVKWLQYRKHILASPIAAYEKELAEARAAEYRASAEENRAPKQYWTGIRPPKELADAVESLLGAMFVSEGFDTRPARAMYEKVMKPFYNAHIHFEDILQLPTVLLSEKLKDFRCQDWRAEHSKLTDEDSHAAYLTDVLVHGVVLASVETGTPFSAYKLAAELALEALDADPTFMATHCDCLARYEVEREARIQAKKDRRKEVRKQRLQEAEQDSAAVDELLGLDDEPLAESDDGGH